MIYDTYQRTVSDTVKSQNFGVGAKNSRPNVSKYTWLVMPHLVTPDLSASVVQPTAGPPGRIAINRITRAGLVRASACVTDLTAAHPPPPHCMIVHYLLLTAGK